MSGGFDTEKSQRGEGVEVKCTWCAVQAWTSYRVQVGSNVRSFIQERAITGSTEHNFHNRCTWGRGTIEGRPESA